MSKDWSWYDEDGKAVTVVPEVSAVAVYSNPRGEIVIRQQAGPQDEEDAVVIVPRLYVPALIAAIQEQMAAAS